jgi:hypothetical protein
MYAAWIAERATQPRTHWPRSTTGASTCSQNGPIRFSPLLSSHSRHSPAGSTSACDTATGLSNSRTSFSRYMLMHWNLCNAGCLELRLNRPVLGYTILVLDGFVRSEIQITMRIRRSSPQPMRSVDPLLTGDTWPSSTISTPTTARYIINAVC